MAPSDKTKARAKLSRLLLRLMEEEAIELEIKATPQSDPAMLRKLEQLLIQRRKDNDNR